MPKSINNKGNFGIQIHQALNNTDFFGNIHFASKNKSQVVFFPGCSFNGYSPDLVMKVYNFLLQDFKGLGISTNCCGKPAQIIKSSKYEKYKSILLKSFQDNNINEIITCCPNCTNLLKEITSIKITSIYSILEKYDAINFNKTTISGALHDPCPFRKNEDIHKSVRSLLSNINVNIEEFPLNKEKTRCCGKSNMLFAKDKKKALSIAKNRADQTQNNIIICYCFSCIDSFKQVSKKSLHVLEVMFGEEKNKSHVWLNRIKLTLLIKNIGCDNHEKL